MDQMEPGTPGPSAPHFNSLQQLPELPPLLIAPPFSVVNLVSSYRAMASRIFGFLDWEWDQINEVPSYTDPTGRPSGHGSTDQWDTHGLDVLRWSLQEAKTERPCLDLSSHTEYLCVRLSFCRVSA